MSQKSVARGWSVTPFFWAKCPLPPPQKKPALAAKPISACLYKTLTLLLYNLINHPSLMGARRSCGQFNLRSPPSLIKSFCSSMGNTPQHTVYTKDKGQQHISNWNILMSHLTRSLA